MSEKVQIHQFDPVLYPFKLWIAITDYLKAVSELFVDHPSGKEFGTDSENMIAFTQNVQQKSDGLIGAIIVFKKRGDCSVKTISHESTHAARIMWDHVSENATGMKTDAEYYLDISITPLKS